MLGGPGRPALEIADPPPHRYAGLAVLQIPLLLQLVRMPFASRVQNRLETLALLATFASLFIGQGISLGIVETSAAASRQGGVTSHSPSRSQLSYPAAIAVVTIINASVMATLLAALGRTVGRGCWGRRAAWMGRPPLARLSKDDPPGDAGEETREGQGLELAVAPRHTARA